MAKDEIDDITEEAVEYIMKPLKTKLFPYLYGVAIFNILLFIMVGYLVWRLTTLVHDD